MNTATVRTWVEGWVVSRGAAPPLEEPWGFTVDVGLAGQVRRHVLPEADEATLRKLMETVTAPGTWIKTFAPPETLAPWLVPGWTFDAPGWLMTTALRRSPVEVPDGYRLRAWSRGGVTRALVVTADGAFAARGQFALPEGGSGAVADQIETSPAHRRRGLGSVVMRTLANAALEAGARTGTLGATAEGKALYESLGWRSEGPLTGIVLDAPGAA